MSKENISSIFYLFALSMKSQFDVTHNKLMSVKKEQVERRHDASQMISRQCTSPTSETQHYTY